jgi:hypothetical protein
MNPMIECGVLFVLAHDHFVLDLSFTWFIINNRGRHFDKMLEWVSWLYEFT